MPRHLNDEEFEKVVLGKKIDRKATAEARRRESPRSSEESFDHPLVEQGKAVQRFVGEVAEAVTALSRMVEMQGKMSGQMLAHLAAMREKRRQWKFKVNRNNQGFIETVDVVPVEE